MSKAILGQHLGSTHQAYTNTMAAGNTTVIKEGVIFLTNPSGAAALTLTAPTAGVDDGKILRIVNAGDGATAPANTVLCAGKIWDGTAGVNGTITMGAFPGASCTLVAQNGFWFTLALNVAPAT